MSNSGDKDSESNGLSETAMEQLNWQQKQSKGLPPKAPARGDTRKDASVTHQSDNARGPQGVANPQEKRR